MLQLSTYTVQQGKLGRKKKKRDKQRKTMRSINQKTGAEDEREMAARMGGLHFNR